MTMRLVMRTNQAKDYHNADTNTDASKKVLRLMNACMQVKVGKYEASDEGHASFDACVHASEDGKGWLLKPV